MINFWKRLTIRPMHDEPELKIDRDAWLLENKIRDKTSKEAPPFPEPNFQKYRDFSSKEMLELFISEDILEEIAKHSNQNALTKKWRAFWNQKQ